MRGIKVIYDMKVVIRKVDLDTACTGLILGVSESRDVVMVKDRADDEEIYDPSVVCIEAGGSGLVEQNNFDHHSESYFPPACRQAYEHLKVSDKRLLRLVEYVCIVDERPEEHPLIPFPSLSNIFSGMLLMEKDIIKQFFKGIKILRDVLDKGIDPFSTMPYLLEWQTFIKAKEENLSNLKDDLMDAKFYLSKGRLKVGFMESKAIGGIGFLYKRGCDVVVLYNPKYGDPPVPKFTIAGNGKNVMNLLPIFDNMERGWGGRETIIGSPTKGSILTKEAVLAVVLENL